MATTLSDYEHKYRHAAFERSDGVLQMTLHSDGATLVWGDGPHSELGHAFADVGADPDNRVVLITGCGDRFIGKLDDSWVGAMTPQRWSKIHSHGRRLLGALLDIEVPVVAAVNGPATVHAELAVLSDIVLAADTAYFQDAPHFRHGTVPGDGVQVVWPLLLGMNRGRYFLLTGQKIAAEEALALGVVSEVHPTDDLLPRAHELAAELARQPTTTLRYTRAVLTQRLKRMVLDEVSYGLALEGLAAHESWPEGP